MINKSNVFSSIYSVRKSFPLNIQMRRNSDFVPKYSKIVDKETTKFKELLLLIEKGGNRIIEQEKARQRVIDKLNKDQIKLQKTQKTDSALNLVRQKRERLNQKCKKNKKNKTQDPDQIQNNQVQRYQYWKSKINQNQISIKFPQLTLVKEALIIQESLMNQKNLKERNKYFCIQKKNLNSKRKQCSSLRSNDMENKRQTNSLQSFSIQASATLQKPMDRDIEQWTISKWA